MRLDAAPQGPFGRDTDWIRCDPRSTDPGAVEMRLPGSLIGEMRRLMCSQLTDNRPGEGSPSHIVQRRLVDDIVFEASTQEIKKVQPALACSGAEPGEIVIADLRAGAVLSSRARAGIVRRGPGCRLQTRPQYVTVLGEEAVLSSDQQAHHLPLGDGDANPPQLCHQPRDDHLPSMVLRQHETTQFWPEMPVNPGWQRSQHHRSIRRNPALPPVTYRLGMQHDVLHHKRLVAFEA